MDNNCKLSQKSVQYIEKVLNKGYDVNIRLKNGQPIILEIKKEVVYSQTQEK